MFFTGFAKVVTICQSTAVLGMSSPVFAFVNNRQMLSMAAGLEFLVVLMIATLKNVSHRLLALLGLSLVFIGYRLALLAGGFHGYCDCLGDFFDGIHVTPEVAEALSLSILAYCFIGAVCFLSWSRVKGKAMRQVA